MRFLARLRRQVRNFFYWKVLPESARDADQEAPRRARLRRYIGSAIIDGDLDLLRQVAEATSGQLLIKTQQEACANELVEFGYLDQVAKRSYSLSASMRAVLQEEPDILATRSDLKRTQS